MKGINVCLNATLAILLSIPPSTFASVWDHSCERAIKALKTEQEEVASAYAFLESEKSEAESAKAMYELCTANAYDDCEFWRFSANNAIQDYNQALNTLRSQISDFGFAADRFKRECLQ